MIVLKACISIHPEKREAFLAALKPLVTASQAEAECMTYEVYEDVAQANRFVFFEEWESRDALHTHESTPHLDTFRAQIGAMIRDRVPSRVYQVETVTTL